MKMVISSPGNLNREKKDKYNYDYTDEFCVDNVYIFVGDRCCLGSLYNM